AVEIPDAQRLRIVSIVTVARLCQQFVEPRAELPEAQARVPEGNAMDVEQPSVRQRSARAIQAGRYLPARQHRRRVFEEVLQAVVERQRRHRMRQLEVRVQKLADCDELELASQLLELLIEFGG